MGGAMALHLACRHHPDIAGVFALSSFLNKDSVAFQVNHSSHGFFLKSLKIIKSCNFVSSSWRPKIVKVANTVLYLHYLYKKLYLPETIWTLLITEHIQC